MAFILPRRRLLQAFAGAGTLFATGCDKLVQSKSVTDVLQTAEGLTMGSQRLLLSGGPLAREFTEAELSPTFRSNGTSMPQGDAYAQLLANKFADYRLIVGGLVAKPLSLSLADLKALPSRTQITRHDCVEGWSAIGKWSGVQLALLLQTAQPLANARYCVFYCADIYERTLQGEVKYYESIDLVDATHPQTILAYALNGQDLPVGNGAPLRLRVERQLGYKQAKYVMGIELVESFADLGDGKGGYWEDRGYEWYGGI